MAPYLGREKEYEEARRLRAAGHGYVFIGKKIGVSWGTVRNWVADIPADGRHAQALHNEIRSANATGKAALRRRIVSQRGRRCEGCGRRTWLGKPIALEMHREVPEHGYVETNVSLLCPNCHAQTSTWKNRSR